MCLYGGNRESKNRNGDLLSVCFDCSLSWADEDLPTVSFSSNRVYAITYLYMTLYKGAGTLLHNFSHSNICVFTQSMFSHK